ncbi:MAG: ATP-binding protein [Pseudomonadales bacterium]|nr:ATP-binding protein [Pseudomonadales bacterium]
MDPRQLVDKLRDGLMIVSPFDRIQPRVLVSEMLLASRPVLARRRIRVSVLGVNQELPVVHGSRHWLVQAMSECIRHMVSLAREDSQFLLMAKNNRGCIAFTLRNTGQALPFQLRDRAFVPIHRNGGPTEGAEFGLGLALCKRVLAQHNGRVHLEVTDGESRTLVMELPTNSMPFRGGTERQEQVRCFASGTAGLSPLNSPDIN